MATTREDRDEAIAANKAIADAFGDRSSFLWISRYSSAKHPLPFYQSALGDRLEYDLPCDPGLVPGRKHQSRARHCQSAGLHPIDRQPVRRANRDTVRPDIAIPQGDQE